MALIQTLLDMKISIKATPRRPFLSIDGGHTKQYTVAMEAFIQNITGGIGAYGLFSASALVLCYIVAILLCVRLRHDTQRQVLAMLLSMAFLYAGAKLFGVISYASYLHGKGEAIGWFVFEKSGIVFYGGLLGYLLGIRILLPRFLRKTGANLTTGYAIAATLFPLFHGIARMGCYFAHCCYGVEHPHFAHFWEGRVPVQLFESLFCLLLFALLLYFLLRYPKLHKWILPVYLFAYSVFRFIIEFWRGDAVRGGFGIFSFSQWVSVCIWIALAIFLLVKYIRMKKTVK